MRPSKRQSRLWPFLVPACLGVFALALADRAGRAQQAGPSSPSEVKPIPLINADEEMGGFVKKATELAEKQDYAGAIDILQALLNRAEQCFVPTSDPRRYLPLASKANEVIGQLPDEGLAMYRREYDLQAQEVLRRAREAMDETGLRGLVRRYLHTSSGDDALNLLGAMQFDRGEFSQAALCWREITRQCRSSDLDQATLLGKTAVAHHLAGEAAGAAEALKELQDRYPNAQACLGGRQVPVVAFVERMLRLSPPERARLAVQEGWCSLAGAPDSMAVMRPSSPVLSPRWTSPGGRLEDNPNFRALVGSISSNQPGPEGARLSQPVLREGHLVASQQLPGQKSPTNSPLPCVIFPVVADGLVLYRGGEGIIAHDLLTGEERWRTFAFPLYRAVSASSDRGYNPYGIVVRDQGIGALTVGDGKVFAVGKFLPPNLALQYMVGGNRPGTPDTSSLEAISLTGEGKRLWRVGDGQGETDLLRGGKFLTAPTFAAGRLYVMVEYMQAFHLACLDAETGRPVWSAMVGQAPVPSTPYSPYRGFIGEQGSPPAVADGRVFAVTNAGVAAAFEADTGRALWAYQYASAYEQDPSRSGRAYRPGQLLTGYPPNPVLVSRGRAVFLPADGESVLALRTDTGELLWSVDRNNQHNLSAIDEQRVLLSQDSLVVLDAAKGEELWPGPQGKRGQVDNIAGRPAVTSETILASGRGELVQVALADFTVSRLPLVDPNALLGNLVCVAGKLLAANAAGLSAYFTYEEARTELTERLDKTAGPQVYPLLYQRGMNAFNAGRPEEALDDLRGARDGAVKEGDTTLVARTGQALYRTYVSLANRASDDAAMLDLFQTAQQHAYSPTSRGEMLIRLMKYYRKITQPARAAEIAQQLTVDFADEELADVEIGSAADPYVRDDPYTTRYRGYDLGHDFIRDLVRTDGQDCYAAFDAKAEAELKQTLSAGDVEAMVGITDRYRHSLWAPMALLRASETLYRQATADARTDNRELLTRAGLHLGRIYQDYPSSGLAASARLGKAMIYIQLKRPVMVARNLRNLEEMPADTRLSFANVSGSRDEVLKRFEPFRRPVRPAESEPTDDVKAPLAKAYQTDKPAVILRDSEGVPVRSGTCLFLLEDDRIVKFDPAADSPEQAVKWKGILPFEAGRMYQFGYAGPALSLCAQLSADGKAVGLFSRGGFTGMDAETGKVLWRRERTDALIASLYALATTDNEVVVVSNTGDLVGIAVTDGKETWRHAIPKQELQFRGPPVTGGGLLLVPHGRTNSLGAVFDLATRKALGNLELDRSNVPQFRLTSDGLAVCSDGKSLRLVEPVLAIDQPIWKVSLPANLQPALLACTDTHVVVSPNMNSGLVEVRSLDDEGNIRRSFQMEAMGGRQTVPVSADVVGSRLFVLGSSQGNYMRFQVPGTRVINIIDPCLQGFDLGTGKALWQVDLSPQRGQNCIVPVSLTRRYVAAVSKESAITRPSVLVLIDAASGKVVERMELPVVQNLPQPMGYFQHMAMGAPVAVKDRLVVETLKGVMVYGPKETQGDADNP